MDGLQSAFVRQCPHVSRATLTNSARHGFMRAPERLDTAPAFCPNCGLFACERTIAYGEVGGSEQFELDADLLAKIIDDLCGDFGRSDAVRCEGGPS
jgi:hypothetical protein